MKKMTEKSFLFNFSLTRSRKRGLGGGGGIQFPPLEGGKQDNARRFSLAKIDPGFKGNIGLWVREEAFASTCLDANRRLADTLTLSSAGFCGQSRGRVLQ